MESLSNGIKTTSGRRRSSGESTKLRSGELARTNPRSQALNRSRRADEFAAFSDEILRDLNPRGPLQRLAADHVVHSAWRLKGSLEKHSAREFGLKSDPEVSGPKVRCQPSELDRSSRSLKDAVETFSYLGEQIPMTIQPSNADPVRDGGIDEVEADIFPNEWPIVPSGCDDELLAEIESPDDEVPSWQDRLIFDFDVSDVSPVVKGTWITVGHVVSMIVDGWTWADILRSHPELTEADIRTCVAYAMDEENTAS